jgi:uncharacterized protein YybS (DUF2232 family)
LRSTRFITEGAVLLAIYSVLLLSFTYLPVLSVVITYLMPLPFILFSLKYSIKETLIMSGVAVGLTMVITSATLIPATIMFSSVGVVLGYLLKKERSKGEILLTSTFLYLIHIVLIYLLAKAMFEIDVVKQMTTSLTNAIEQSKTIYSDLGVKYNEKSLESLSTAIDLIPTLLPTLLLATSFVVAFLTQLLTFPIVKRFGYKIPKFKPFREFRLPVGFMWFFLIVMIISVFKLNEDGFLYTAVINLAYVFQVLLIIQGFAAIFYFSHIRKLSKAIPIIVLVASLIIQLLMIIVMLIGIVSIGFFNRRKK